jgi:hypothetical protein
MKVYGVREEVPYLLRFPRGDWSGRATLPWVIGKQHFLADLGGEEVMMCFYCTSCEAYTEHHIEVVHDWLYSSACYHLHCLRCEYITWRNEQCPGINTSTVGYSQMCPGPEPMPWRDLTWDNIGWTR